MSSDAAILSVLGGKETETAIAKSIEFAKSELPSETELCVDGDQRAWVLAAKGILDSANSLLTDLGLENPSIEGPTDPSAKSISGRTALKQYSQRILEQVKEKLKGRGLSNAQIIDLLDVYRNATAAKTIKPQTEIKVKISEDFYVTSTAEQSIANSEVYKNFVKQYFKPQTEATAADAASESPQSKYDLAACLEAYKNYKADGEKEFPKLSFAEFFFIANNHQKLDEGCFVSSQFRWAHNVANFFNNKVTVMFNGSEQTLIDFYTSAAPASKERMDFLDSKGVKTCTTLMEPSATTKFFGALAVPALRLEWAMIKKLKKFAAATKEGLKVIVAPAKFQLEDLVGVGKSSIAKMVNQYAKEAIRGGYALSCKSGKDRTGIIAAMISATAVAMWQDSTIKGQVTGKSGGDLKKAFLDEMASLDLDEKLQNPEFYKNFVTAFLKQIPARNFIANANTVGCAGLQIGKMYQIQYLINKGKKLASQEGKKLVPQDENLTAMITLLKNYNKQQVASGSLTKLNKFKGLVKKAGKIKRAVQQVVQKVKEAVSRGR